MNIEFTEQALQQLDDIYDYLAVVSGVSVAERITAGITDRIDGLATLPFLAPKSGHPSGTRKLVQGSYIIYYLLETEAIVVSRILHHSRDQDAVLD